MEGFETGVNDDEDLRVKENQIEIEAYDDVMKLEPMRKRFPIRVSEPFRASLARGSSRCEKRSPNASKSPATEVRIFPKLYSTTFLTRL